MQNICVIVIISIFILAKNTFSQSSPLWMRYPAISPDGKNIVFSYQGDIYKVSVQGGLAIPLTQHPAHDTRPIWSRDGKSVAFASDRYGNYDIFLVSENGGSPIRLTYHSGNDIPFSFTPDDKNVLFKATRMDVVSSVMFPYRAFSELYSVPVTGGRQKQILSTPAEDAIWDKTGKKLYYHDIKGGEDPFRKHHISSVARDIWVYDATSGKHTKLTDFEGEDRSPVLSPDAKELYFLSEKTGSFNIWKMSLENPKQITQVTKHKDHPVRSLSIANDGTLCYGYRGEIYIRKGNEDIKVNIQIINDNKENEHHFEHFTSGATELEISPNGKEVVFVVRGEVFVASLEHGTTKRITNTPEQERSVSFSPDGKAILYASERNGSWNIYQTKRVREEEPYFYLATVLKEEPLLVGEEEEFQPVFSPDGKEIAYLEERTTIKVYNLNTRQSRTVLGPEKNYSYIDGDMYFAWSPDSRYLLAECHDNERWSSDICLIDVSGKEQPINLTQSGYSDNVPKWMLGGKMMIWLSDRYGRRGSGSGGGSEIDVMGMWFDNTAYQRFKMSKAELDAQKEIDNKNKKEEKKDEKEKKEVQPLILNLKNLDERTERLTTHASNVSDAVLSPDGEKLYYLTRFEKGADLWVHKLYEHEVKLITKLEGPFGGIIIDKEGKFLYIVSNGTMTRINSENGERKMLTFNAEMELKPLEERKYLFEHVWRQTYKKFYVKDMHGVDWKMYKKEYERFLPFITHNRDFAEMLSEMLGELNASHTGSGYRPTPNPKDDATASLGVFYDENYTGKGLKIAEIMDKSPLWYHDNVKAGMIIEKIDDVEITPDLDYFKLLNHKAGKFTLLTIYDEANAKRFDITVKPISLAMENELMYLRWVKIQEAMVDKLSDGKIGYVHVRGMNDASFREVFSKMMGKYHAKQGIIVDTRCNGGGWLHDQLAVLLSGKKYLTFYPREQKGMGGEPLDRWYKKSVVLMNEANYSDANLFPYIYQYLGLGKLVGMPVPGTGTAVWWETLQDNTLYFGIPQVGMLRNDGKYMENTQLEPDIQQQNDYDQVIKGKDQQLEKAIEFLLKN
ncbi:MAG: S41 family peptidase [Bacteroidia bacterium]|nr:S41 family peptidase [Bacteroidia bacterium]